MTPLPTVEHPGELPIREVARRTGFSRSTLRYYESIGLVSPIARDDSSGHRRYDEDAVQVLEALACLRTTGMGVDAMRTYLRNMARGRSAASDQRQLFEEHRDRVSREIEQLRTRSLYLDGKARLWAAREAEDATAEDRAIRDLGPLTEALR
ncbi:MerR family transcriptional regulator [Patulibacter sp.]|uniref:MerR family transcriptional regulator n=1 Tax=Patulibacter sp. TaxID=1912859 RepID=UPI00272862E1|nr:MerR family transcriptional regulator [Patulibacter sp.]MDO9408862.1 MerR family transcriptional regulator [Patulibacter sp.]